MDESSNFLTTSSPRRLQLADILTTHHSWSIVNMHQYATNLFTFCCYQRPVSAKSKSAKTNCNADMDVNHKEKFTLLKLCSGPICSHCIATSTKFVSGAWWNPCTATNLKLCYYKNTTNLYEFYSCLGRQTQNCEEWWNIPRPPNPALRLLFTDVILIDDIITTVK